jgi:hypothetical protein
LPVNQLAWPLGLAVAGALTFAVAGNAKLAELGKLLFFAPVFWLVYALSGRALRF